MAAAGPHVELGLADSSLAHVARAVRWIQDHYAEPFRVEELARLAVAHRVGYDSPSQFSREYRRRYGVPPSRDATRLHAGAGADHRDGGR